MVAKNQNQMVNDSKTKTETTTACEFETYQAHMSFGLCLTSANFFISFDFCSIKKLGITRLMLNVLINCFVFLTRLLYDTKPMLFPKSWLYQRILLRLNTPNSRQTHLETKWWEQGAVGT